jgi:hypothetical protein
MARSKALLELALIVEWCGYAAGLVEEVTKAAIF